MRNIPRTTQDQLRDWLTLKALALPYAAPRLTPWLFTLQVHPLVIARLLQNPSNASQLKSTVTDLQKTPVALPETAFTQHHD